MFMIKEIMAQRRRAYGLRTTRSSAGPRLAAASASELSCCMLGWFTTSNESPSMLRVQRLRARLTRPRRASPAAALLLRLVAPHPTQPSAVLQSPAAAPPDIGLWE